MACRLVRTLVYKRGQSDLANFAHSPAQRTLGLGGQSLEPASSMSQSRLFCCLHSGSVGNVAALLVCPQLDAWPSMFYLFGGMGLVWVAFCLLRLCSPSSSSSALADQDHEPRLRPRVTHESALLPRHVLLARLLRCKPLYGICAAHFAQVP